MSQLDAKLISYLLFDEGEQRDRA